MPVWLSYRPEDFLLFSERVYWRLFELHNQQLWPVQIVALSAGFVTGAMALRGHRRAGRATAAALAVGWMTVAGSFMWDRYAEVNWAASYVALAFVAESLLLAWLGVLGNALQPRVPRRSRASGLALFLYALVVHPLVPLISGRPWQGAEIVGLAPDPTAIATMGIIVMAEGRMARWLLLAVPSLWCLASFLTLHTMEVWEAWIPIAAFAVALGSLVLRELQRRNVSRF